MSAILDFSTEQNVGAETIQCPIGLKVDTRVSLELAKSHGTYFMCPYKKCHIDLWTYLQVVQICKSKSQVLHCDAHSKFSLTLGPCHAPA